MLIRFLDELHHLAVRELRHRPVHLDPLPVGALDVLGLPHLDALDRGIREGPLERGRAANLGGLPTLPKNSSHNSCPNMNSQAAELSSANRGAHALPTSAMTSTSPAFPPTLSINHRGVAVLSIRIGQVENLL